MVKHFRQFPSIASSLRLQPFSCHFVEQKMQPKNCSETALKLVRRKGVFLETQTLNNEAKINVL